MSDYPKVPEEAVEAGVRAAVGQLGGISHDTIIRERIVGVLQAATPAIRKQERERAGDAILQALDMRAELDEDIAERVGGIVLDTLEDS